MRSAVVLLLLLLTSIPASAQQKRNGSDAVAQVGVLAGVRGWKTAFRKSDATFMYGVHAGWFPTRWLEITGSFDHAERAFDPGDIRIRNTENWLLLGPRISTWYEVLRFFVEGTVGPVLRTVSYNDESIGNPSRFSAGFGFGAGFTVVVAGRVALTTRGAWRHRDNVSNTLATLDVAWLFAAKN